MNIEVIHLGTAAGPAIRSHEAGISTAVLVGDKHYIVDFGLGTTFQAGHGGLLGKNFRAGFITHLHSDHLVDLPGYLLWNWGVMVDGFVEPITIVGPGRDPQYPTLSGTSDFIDHIFQAYSYDLAIREVDEARENLESKIRVTEVQDQEATAPAGVLVYEDDRVQVRALQVDHPPITPALAYRFDSEAGSVTISGDTAESPALAQFAADCDMLVHEAVFLPYYESQNFPETFVNHQRYSHTTPAGAGRVAAAARVQTLALSHLAGVADDDEWQTEAARHFDGHIYVASTGMRRKV